MNEQEKIQLQKMIQANDTEDHTEVIRRVKHSGEITTDVLSLLKIKKDYARLAKSNPTQYDAICVSRCKFLFTYYTDIFNRLKRDEIDITMLFQLISVLKAIEDGKVDQHEGSFEVGKILKKIYIDSALKRSEHLDAEQATREKREKKPVKAPAEKISWAEYKAKIANTDSAKN